MGGHSVFVYHFALKSNLDSILNDGFKTYSNYEDLGTDLRKDVIYCWLDPTQDVMGYDLNEDYACLKIKVRNALVADMSLISSAYVNQMVGNDDLFSELISAYSKTVELNEYVLGHFRVPEILLKSDDIIDFEVIELSERINENILIYNRSIENRYGFKIDDPLQLKRVILELVTKGDIKRVAVHDDSTGMLVTYRDNTDQSYFTIPVNPELNYELVDGFFA
jgi:hypothetical protein